MFLFLLVVTSFSLCSSSFPVYCPPKVIELFKANHGDKIEDISEVIEEYCKREWEIMLWNGGRDLNIYSYSLSSDDTAYKIVVKNRRKSNIEVLFMHSSIMLFYSTETNTFNDLLVKHFFLKIEVPSNIQKEDITYVLDNGSIYFVIPVPHDKTSLFEGNTRMSEPKLYIEIKEKFPNDQTSVIIGLDGSPMIMHLKYPSLPSLYYTYLPYQDKMFQSSVVFTDCDYLWFSWLINRCKWYFDMEVVHYLEMKPVDFYRKKMSFLNKKASMQALAYGFIIEDAER